MLPSGLRMGTTGLAHEDVLRLMTRTKLFYAPGQYFLFFYAPGQFYFFIFYPGLTSEDDLKKFFFTRSPTRARTTLFFYTGLTNRMTG